MTDAMPILLVPGLACSPLLFAPQLSALWQRGPVTIADTRRGDSMAAMARQILDSAPPRFALAGLSMGGYLAFEIMRQAPERVSRLAILDSAANPERPEQTERRKAHIALAEGGRFGEIPGLMMPVIVHADFQADEAMIGIVRAMHEENGAEAYVAQQRAIMARPDSRPGLAAIRCPALVLVGDADLLTPPDAAREIAAGIAGAKLVVVPDCGHLSTLERPDAVTQALLDWLAA
jgi:pimeloyl-ACP methyl ester carboxylesterase